MFEFFFKYPVAVFTKGQFVFLNRWPFWVLVCLVVVAAVVLAAPFRRPTGKISGVRKGVIWLLESALAASILLLLWQPAVSVATLKTQQNVIAVVVDDSRSMAVREPDGTRRDHAARLLESGLRAALAQKFQVRLYRLGSTLERFDKTEQLTASAPSTRIGEGLRQVAAEAASLPIGAVILLSDGADNAGGIDLATLAEVRQRRIPVHAIGLGRERFERDLEISDVEIPPRAWADSRINAQVSFRQRGYSRSKARLVVKDGSKVIASREVVLREDGVRQTETAVFDAGVAGAHNLRFAIDPLAGEENLGNNGVSRLLNVESQKRRILYVEGEPRWEFKFIRRALDEERTLKLVSMLRTTENKIYRQGIDDPHELVEGFPAKAEELFAYQAVIVGSLEAGYFTAAQLDLLREFVDRRGGGLLFLGGRAGLGEGGWGRSAVADLLPVVLPERKGTFHRERAGVEVTPAGRENLICRLEDNPERNAERWKKLPSLMDYQETGAPKPGAVVLAEAVPSGTGRMPLLVTQSYGRGRTAVFATGGSWRWQMLQDLADRTHETFWQQLLRWLADSPGQVVAATPRPMLSDERRVPIRVEVRDKTYLPSGGVRVEARISGPDGITDVIEMTPDPSSTGTFTGEWNAEKAGGYMAEVVAQRGEEEVGRDILLFHREDGVAENFRAEQNRELLETLSEQTGGRYYRPQDWAKLASEISYSEAGVTVRETKDLWDMPAVFLALIAIRSMEWLLRRRWGAV